VPTTPFTETGGTYDLSQITNIVVDFRYADEVDQDSQTWIPPTLQQFAETFQEDLKSVLGLNVNLTKGTQRKPNTIFVTLGNNTDFKDAAGRFTSEGYDLKVDNRGLVVTGASPLGAWWATRSIIQAAAGDSKISKGLGTDAPAWGTRGAFVSDSQLSPDIANTLHIARCGQTLLSA
jgi:hexosaminidase